jgi:hypothetical protein
LLQVAARAICVDGLRLTEKMSAISNQASGPKRNLNEAVKESSRKQPISVIHWPLLAEIRYSMRDILL